MAHTLAHPVAHGAADAVAALVLTEFRNYERLELAVDPRPVVLLGANGAGKTNLLEALSFLAPGRGLRQAALDEVTRRTNGTPPATPRAWGVVADVAGADGPVRIGTGLAAEDAGRTTKRRTIRIDGETVRGQDALAESLAVAWLTPEHDGLFAGPAAERRRFLDRLIYGLDPAHAGRVAAYEQAMRQRLRLLKEGGTDGAWLTAQEDTMARYGVAVAAARAAFTEKLAAACALGIGPFPTAALHLVEPLAGWLRDAAALAVEDRLREELAARRRSDALAGRTEFGVHRSDLEVVYAEKEMPASLCSTGEQKALLLSVFLANARLVAAERGAAPLLLLDEIAAHLDAGRREALFEEIRALGCQAWMSGTDIDDFAALGDEAQRLAVEGGRVSALDGRK
jgi:DNA replication and repair protein RecF